MKMIVGLGNPGKEYEGTRHNVGFMVMDFLSKDFVLEKKFQAYLSKIQMAKEEVLLVKPITFMNLSGLAVSKLANYFHIPSEDIFIVQDDLDLPFGTWKIKINSSSGGHNGIKSILESLHTNAFPRLKIGISKNKNIDTKDYVLGSFSKEEKELLNQNMPTFQKIIETYIEMGIQRTMTKFNGAGDKM